MASSASWPTRSPCPGSGRASTTAPPSSATCAVASSASTTGWPNGITELGGDLRFGTEVREVSTDATAGGLTVTPAEERSSGRPGGLHARGAAHLPAGAGAARRLSVPPRVGEGLRRALPGAGARPAADGELLDERQRPGLPVHGARRAHQLHGSRRLRRAAPRLPGQLPADGRSAAAHATDEVVDEFAPHLARINPAFDRAG